MEIVVLPPFLINSPLLSYALLNYLQNRNVAIISIEK